MSAPLTRVTIITGLSGSGKSTALRALEDLGWFCIDNLPIVLLPQLLALSTRGAGEIDRVALVVDARESAFLDRCPDIVAEVRREGHEVEVLYLDTDDAGLLRRYSETRRRHPLAEEGTVEEGVGRERGLLAGLRALADEVIDTSGLTVHELKALIQGRFEAEGEGRALRVTFMSFGFKHGLPIQADLVFDVRFLPNPHFVEHLRPRTGLDPEVAAYVLERDETAGFLDRVQDLLTFLLPRYLHEGKSYLTVAIGCTGGRHRSVALAETLSGRLLQQGYAVGVQHRDAQK